MSGAEHREIPMSKDGRLRNWNRRRYAKVSGDSNRWSGKPLRYLGRGCKLCLIHDAVVDRQGRIGTAVGPQAKRSGSLEISLLLLHMIGLGILGIDKRAIRAVVRQDKLALTQFNGCMKPGGRLLGNDDIVLRLPSQIKPRLLMRDDMGLVL